MENKRPDIGCVIYVIVVVLLVIITLLLLIKSVFSFFPMFD